MLPKTLQPLYPFLLASSAIVWLSSSISKSFEAVSAVAVYAAPSLGTKDLGSPGKFFSFSESLCRMPKFSWRCLESHLLAPRVVLVPVRSYNVLIELLWLVCLIL